MRYYFLILSKLENNMKKIESPPTSGNQLDVMTRLDTNGRSIFHIIDDSQVINQINEDYLYWDKAKYKVPTELQEIIDPEELWQLVKRERRSGQKALLFAGQLFTFTSTNFIFSRLHELDLNLGGSLGGQETLTEADRHRYLIGSIMEESIASSQIEGAVTSRMVAKDMLRKNRPPRSLSERMILNNYQTIRHIINHKNRPLTPVALLELHRLMTNDTLERSEEAGQFRLHDDIHVVDAIDGEVINTPPTHTILSSFVQDLCRFFNDETPTFFLHPVVKASIVHFLIGYFHPFTDGNGRTARALFYWYLLRKGYWLTEYLSISRIIMQSRAQYYRAFQYAEVDENDLSYFILYQIKTLHQAYTDLKKYIERKIQEKSQLLAYQRIEGLSPRQAQIVSWLQEDPNSALSAKEVENRLGVSNQTARNDIAALIKKGYVAELAINQKERQYIRGKRFEE